ncbi:MAG TPA: hypothetical protein VMW50_03935 [Dehalococcoidia bacterium]|nr:hypothetical protein [Dehalococcoidia bacterium]
MRAYIPLTILLLSLTMEASGQEQRAGAFDKQFPSTSDKGLPGQHDRGGLQACQADLSNLRRLADEQRKYIELLEKKIESLKQQPAARKGSKP